ncbi:hypothetical protein [Streptomyces griseoruber]|uniref:hypothetical protein n=1 Tax=Streptomyces griseoruber TaxID=1943 RepID=UPI003795B7DC
MTRLRSVLSTEEATVSGLPSRASLVSQADRLQQEINTLEEQRRAIKDTVRSKRRVLGATLAKAVQ